MLSFLTSLKNCCLIRCHIIIIIDPQSDVTIIIGSQNAFGLKIDWINKKDLANMGKNWESNNKVLSG